MEEKYEFVIVRGAIWHVHLTRDTYEQDGWTVQCLERPSAISQGDTIHDALENILDALEMVLEHENFEPQWHRWRKGKIVDSSDGGN